MCFRNRRHGAKLLRLQVLQKQHKLRARLPLQTASTILDPGTWILHPGLWILDPGANKMKSELQLRRRERIDMRTTRAHAFNRQANKNRKPEANASV